MGLAARRGPAAGAVERQPAVTLARDGGGLGGARQRHGQGKARLRHDHQAGNPAGGALIGRRKAGRARRVGVKLWREGEDLGCQEQRADQQSGAAEP